MKNQPIATADPAEFKSGEGKEIDLSMDQIDRHDTEIPGYSGVGSDITESIEVLKALKQSESRLRDFATAAADWFFELDASLTITYYSSSFHIPSGESASDVIGRSELDLCKNWSNESQSLQHYLACLQRHELIDIEVEIYNYEGGSLFLHINARPGFDKAGNFQGYRGCSRNITEARKAQRALEKSETRFRNIVESVTDIITTVGEDGVYKYHNKAIEQLLGFTREEALNWEVGDAAIAEDREIILEAHRKAKANPGQIAYATYRSRHKDGSQRVFQTTRQLIDQPGSEVSEMVIHARDITDQFLAEEALKHSEERLRDFAEIGADWFWEQDADLRFTYLSGHYPDFEFNAADGAIGKTREELVPQSNFQSEEWKLLQAKLAARKPFHAFDYALPRQDGSEAMMRVSGIPKFDADGSFSGYRGTGVDITESYKLSEQLNYQATHDPLTGLVNRREFEIRLSRVVKSCQEDDSEHALCYIDLDQFKVVNDTCGHDAGDELLRQISALLDDKVRKRDTIARLGGDEFGLLLERCTLTQANRVAETVRESIDAFRFMWAGRHFRLGASIGVIPINFSSGNISNVMRSADAACYAAKDAGRNRIHVYSEDNVEVAQRRQEMLRIFDINQAFDEDRFILYQQPIETLNPNLAQDGHFCEILVRMVDEDGFPIQPGIFLATAERYNLITQLDTWVVNSAFDWLASNPNVRCNINLSAMSIVDEDFLKFILDLLESTRVRANRVCFEITETAAIANLSKATYFINQLRERGCFFALDDFGSGLSSFAYLKTLPVNFLKIDGFFVRDMVEDRIDYELVKSINEIGHVMGKLTIAEFVENDEILQALKDIGIDYAQGFSLAKPEPIRSYREIDTDF